MPVTGVKWMKAIVAVKPGDSFDHWHDVTCRQFSTTQCNKVAEEHFRAQVTIRQFGELVLSRIWSATYYDEAIRVTRRPVDIRNDHRDCFMLWLMLTGTAGLNQEGRYASLKSGDMVIQDQSIPFELEFGRHSHAAMVVIPRPMLASRLCSSAKIAARKIPGVSPIAPFVGAHIKQLFSLDETIGDPVDRQLGASTLDIVSTVLETEFGQLSPDYRLKDRLDKVKGYMLAHMYDCDLNVDAIAQITSTTRRTLYRLFAQESTTPVQWLWEQRLLESYRLLSEGQVERITEVAMACGFKDLSHFSRAFRAKFGRSPSSISHRYARRHDRPVVSGLCPA